MIQSFRDLEVWEKAIQLVKEIYLVTKGFPKEEIYGLTSQLRRAAVSIASNIAEGKARQTKKEYIQFLYVALGSAAELETQIVISKELDYMDNKVKNVLLEKSDHVSRMLRNLIKSLKLIADNRKPITDNRL